MGSRKLSKFLKILLTAVIILAGDLVLASDNVLQAIQIDGVKDSYNIILKSDDVAEMKKTVQAPNKMVLTLKGIRASKTINTIYNNTSSVDSVVVEPMGEETVKILIQASNVANAGIHFDTLKTPLGVLDKSQPSNKANSEVVLSDPIKSYTPVYNTDENAENGFSLTGAGSQLKNVFSSEKITWVVALGMFVLVVITGLKTIKSKDSEIKIGLTQSLKDREIEMYKTGSEGLSATLNEVQPSASAPAFSANSYGLRAYQNGMRSPYLTPEIQRTRPAAPAPAPSVNPQAIVNSMVKKPAMQSQAMAQNTIKPTNTFSALKTAPAETKTRTTNIDSIKFLESMTKIYEKNGRKDLAQGLRANMKKVQKTTI